MAFNNNERFQREYVSDNNRHMVQPIDCVPEERTKKGWTKGIKAWDKIDGSDTWVGWFTPPRKKAKAPSYGKRGRSSTLVLTRKGDKKTKIVNEKRLRRQAWNDPTARASMLRQARHAKEGEIIADIISTFDDTEVIGDIEEE